MIQRIFRRCVVALAVSSALGVIVTPTWAADEAKTTFNIPAQDLSAALRDYARQANREILFSSEVAQGKTTAGVNANVSADEALNRLLAGTGLVAARSADGTTLVTTPDAKEASDKSGPSVAPEGARLGQRTPGAEMSRENEPQRMAALEDVIVTARKREESILKVPVIENVITQESLEKYGTKDLFDVATRTPGFGIGTGIVSAGPQVSIRGIGTTANNATIDQSVSLNIDGLQFSQGMAYSVGMFDVGQVEILKGPQALYFGKSSTAGVVSLRSADPTDKTEVIARTEYEYEANEKVATLIASGPVSSTLKLRLATRYSDQDGFFHNIAVATPGLGGVTPSFRDVSPTKDWIVRGTALWEPNDVYNLRLKANFSRDDIYGNTAPLELMYCPDGKGGVPPVNVAFIAGDDCKLNRTINSAWADPAAFPGIPHGGVPFAHTFQSFGTLDQNLKFTDALTLTSVTGLYSMSQDTLFAANTGSGVTQVIVADNGFGAHQFTEELRLTSDFVDSPVNFTAGAFYQDGSQTVNVITRANTLFKLPAVLASVIHGIDIRSTSFFGQLNWKVMPTLEIAPGARWTHESRTHTEDNFFIGSGPLGPVSLLDPKLSSDKVSPELSITYTPTDDRTVFASYRKGFKSGSFNTIQFISPTTPSSFDDEEAQGGEIGFKARMLDRRLAINVAAYDYHYKNLQVGANTITNGVLALTTLNAASADVYGVDFDALYAPERIDGLTLNAAINYNHARYDSFTNAPCGNGQTIAAGCDTLFNAATGRFTSQDLSGKPLVRAPTVTANLGADYEMPFRQDWKLDMGASVSYSTRYSTALVDLPGFDQKAFAKINANIALKSPDDVWEIALIGNNLANKITTGQCFNSNAQNGTILGGQIAGAAVGGPAGEDEAACTADRGRAVWLRLTWRIL